MIEAFYASLGVLAAAVVALLFAEKRGKLAHTVALLALASTLALTAYAAASPGAPSRGEVYADQFSLAVALVALLDAAVAVAGFREPTREYKYGNGVYMLSLAGVLGLLGVAWSGSMLMLFTSWTLFSAASYALIAVPRDKYSASGAAKYGLMSLAASNLLLLSLALVTSETKTLSLTAGAAPTFAAAVGATALLAAALGFKVGVFPFHAWLPDTYGYADPLPVSLVAPLSKAATILAVYKLSQILLGGAGSVWLVALGGLAVLTMTYANVTALLQRGLQGLLAYSSIAQAGYLLVGLASLALPDPAARSTALYGLMLQVLAYSLAKTGLFLFARMTRASGEKPTPLEGVRGLALSDPVLAAAVAVLTLSLMGMPPLAGFWGKLYLFLAPVYAAPWLTGAALINTGVAAAYYARLLKAVYFEEGQVRLQAYKYTRLAIWVCAALTLAAGALPLVLHP